MQGNDAGSGNRSAFAGADVIALIEGAYRLDLDDAAWLGALAELGGALFDRGLGSVVFLYKLEAGEPTITSLRCQGAFDPSWLLRIRERLGVPQDVVGGKPLGWKDWLHLPCGNVRDVVGPSPFVDALQVFGGARDVFALNGGDPLGYGVWMGAPRARAGKLSPRTAELYTRLAAHLAAGYRVRRVLAQQANVAPEAVLTGDGALLHAEGRARTSERRELLQHATRRRDAARSRTGRRDPERATSMWRGLVDGRWTLIDREESDGRRLVIATPNEVELAHPRPLSARERQVLGYAALGRSNKEIAYELGLSSATVRVLMARAASKLGARGRAEAVKLYQASGRGRTRR